MLLQDALTYSGLELRQVSRAQGVRLGNDGNQIDAGAKALHDFNIQRLQGVSSGSDEIQAGMDAEVDLVGAAGLLLLEHVRLVLVVQEFDDGLPRVAVVDIVAETGSVNDSEADLQLLAPRMSMKPNSYTPLKNFSSSSAFVISISTVLSICLLCRRLWSA